MTQSPEGGNRHGLHTGSKNRTARKKAGLKRKRRRSYAQVVGGLFVLVFLTTAVLIIPRIKPDIALQQTSGPYFSEETGLYEYQVEASVRGYPRPTVRIGHAAGQRIPTENEALIVLAPGQVHTVTAIARSLLGGSVAQLTLTAPQDHKKTDPNNQNHGDDETDLEIRKPVELVFSGDPIRLQTSGAADWRQYTWQITGPDDRIIEVSGNPIEWVAPELWGTYALQVTAIGSTGQIATGTSSLTVHPVLVFPAVSEWSGTIFDNRSLVQGDYVFTGDDALNRVAKGYISFRTDLPIPFDFTVQQVELRLEEPQIVGRPSVLHRSGSGLWVTLCTWGARPITASDWDIAAVPVISVEEYDVQIISKRWTENELLARRLEDDLKHGRGQLQLRLQFAREESNGDNRMDGVEYDLGKALLKVKLVLNLSS